MTISRHSTTELCSHSCEGRKEGMFNLMTHSTHLKQKNVCLYEFGHSYECVGSILHGGLIELFFGPASAGVTKAMVCVILSVG